MSNIAIIPARGGSKRLPGKNIKELCGRPLIMYSVESALESGKYDEIIVTSDSDEILACCEGVADIVRTHKRPTYLASDTSTVLSTVESIFEEEKDKHDPKDTISLLLPTCPLRTAKDIKAAFELLSDKVDSVVSITEYNFPPQLGLVVDSDGFVQPYHSSDPFRKGKTRSQDYPTVFRPNGAIYLSWWGAFDKHRNYFKGDVVSYFMPPVVSVDIDTELDMIIAAETIRYYGLPMNTK